MLALADASHGLRHVGDRLRDPWLYRPPGRGYAADFNDVATGNNDFTGTNGGR